MFLCLTNRLSLFSIAINDSYSVGVFSFSLICESIEAPFQTLVLLCGGRFSSLRTTKN